MVRHSGRFKPKNGAVRRGKGAAGREVGVLSLAADTTRLCASGPQPWERARNARAPTRPLQSHGARALSVDRHGSYAELERAIAHMVERRQALAA